jgi:heme A synthase
LSRLAFWAYLGVILLLGAVVLGSFTRAYDAGMACGPHWPTCNGELIPSFNFLVALEYFHRVFAALGSLMLALAFTASIRIRRVDNGVFLWGLAAFSTLLAQVLLGMVVVKTGLEPRISAAHTILATATIALATGLTVKARALARGVA